MHVFYSKLKPREIWIYFRGILRLARSALLVRTREDRHRHRVSSLTPHPPMQILGYYLKISHHRFLPHRSNSSVASNFTFDAIWSTWLEKSLNKIISKHTQFKQALSNVSVMWLALLLRIRKTSASNLDCVTYTFRETKLIQPTSSTYCFDTFLILSSQLRLGFHSGFFSSDLPTKILYAFESTRRHNPEQQHRHTNFSSPLLDLMTLVIFGDE
jgi:hypothetical protein